ncbi:MAG: ubiquinol-cytochrome c reductase iron-sulfur subunit [Desulfosarcinaceae bacterium]|jgi:cytochrome b6-f complex iron-sulfur subunit
MPDIQREVEEQFGKNRRRFLLGFGWTGLGLWSAAALAGLLRFIWPRVSVRPSKSVAVGYPEDYLPGQVVYNQGHQLFVIRDAEGFVSLSARCTHLGCNVVWNQDHHIFLCPCHGGKYDRQGRNLEGPPPRPLDQFEVRLNRSGSLVVDQDRIIRRGPGPLPHFSIEKA